MSRGAGRGGDNSGSQDALDTMGYGEALNELESILAELEHEAVDVDHLVERVQRAATLIRLCRGRIASARIEIEAVVADLERATGDESGGAPESPA
jgi:exodeoxyribonuclease VII small subunit